jgi:broad specificity phosphatase PhoE
MAAEAGYNHCMSVSVVYETHSISVDNERGIATGWLEGALSEAGRAGARRLGERRRNDELAAVFTSDLRRAVETAEIAFSGSEIPVYRDRRLRECNYGSMNGMPAAQLEGERRRRLDEPFPGGESWRQAVERVGGFLDDLSRSHDSQRVLIIGHVATRWALDHVVLGMTLEELVDAPFDWREGWEYTLPDASSR